MVDIDKAKCARCGACVRDCIVGTLKTGSDGFPVMTPEDAEFCIQCQHCLAVCPKGAVTCNGVSAADVPLSGQVPDPDRVLNLLRQRRSVRHFKDENVSGEILKKLEDSLRWSPTGCNARMLHFSIVEDKARMEFYREEVRKSLLFLQKTGIMQLFYPNLNRYLDKIKAGEDVIFRKAPHIIVASVHKKAPCKEADPWLALSYFDCMAQSLGLGTCWCGFGVYAFKYISKIRKTLELPDGFRVAAVMLFGYPDVTYARATLPQEFPVHRI